MPKLTQNFNISPYFDDYDEANKFFKILFRPGYSVQARELTQIQSLIQNQIEKVGDTLYSDGTRVRGGEVTLNTKINSLKLKTNYAGNLVTASNFVNRVIVGQTSGARAEVVAAAQYTNVDLNTLMINYVDDTLFLDDEVISTVDTGVAYFANVAGADEGLSNSTELTTSVASSIGSVVSINEGIFYIGGYFVIVTPQTIILDKYQKNPTYRIGLNISEEIITSVDDSNLLDNSIGSPNYTAPGANRYKIDLQLVKKNFYENGSTIISSGVTFSIDTKDNRSGTVNITTATDHNLNPGDVVVINGADQDEYNGKHTVSSVSSTTTFSYFIQGKPDTPATGEITYIKGIVNPIEKNADDGFIELLRIENGEKTEEIKFPVLGDIEKTLARRTYDASGDFTVRPFTLEMELHKIQGTAADRTVGNTSDIVTANGSNFIADVNVGDVIFLSGNVNRTGTVDTISNTTKLTISTGTALGDGSENQKIGIDTRLKAALGPGKAYVKGFEFETVSTTFLDVNKGRDTRDVLQEKQGVEFGPFLRVTDLFSGNFILDIGANTANGAANGAGMQIMDLHCVKWPSTTRTGITAGSDGHITANANSEISFAGIATGSDAAISNTKIGTVRLRQLDFYSGRSSSINDKYAVTVSDQRTMHRVYPTIYDAHVFDFRFNKVADTVSAADSNTVQIKLATDKFATVNAIYGASITVNTSYLGVTTSDTRKIISWTGSNTTLSPASSYTAVLDSALTQQTRSDSTYSIDFSIKDIRSLITTDGSGNILSGMNIDTSGKLNGIEEQDTILFDNNDDQRTLLFPFQNKGVANTRNLTYKLKRMFKGQLTGHDLTVGAPSGEKFYPGTDGSVTLSGSEADANYLVIVNYDAGNDANGDILEFSNASGSSLSNGRSISISSEASTLTVVTDSQLTTVNADFSYESSNVQVLATMIVENALLGTTLGKKTLVQGNTTVANVSTIANTTTANLTQATSGQIAITPMNVSPGATNSLRIADVKKLVAVIDSGNVSQNVTNTMVVSAVASAAGGTPSAYDITSRFTFDNGQRDNYYDYATITLKPGADKPVGQVMAIVDYYTHTGYGPFTVDSYIWSGSGNTPYAEIPSHTSPVTGQKTELRDVIDFRPKRIGIETANNDGYSYTNDFASSNVFAAKVLPDYDYTLDSDYTHYLPRKDKIALGRDREFKVIQGISDINPVLPPDDDDSMTLYTMEIPAYTFNPSDVKVRYIDNKRYTMRDIGKLERRIENLEYYVSLSLLEKEADSLVISDTNNNDRFKNGILVDPFAGHNIGDVFNLDYKVAVDYDKKQLRPTFNSDAYKFKFVANSQSTLVNNSGIISLPFVSNTVISQPFTGSLEGKNVSKTFKINPFSLQNYMGQLKMDPYGDVWYDQSTRAEIKVNIEGQYDNWENMLYNYGHGSHWNDWEEIWSGKQINNELKEGIRDSGDVASNDRKAKTTLQQKTLVGLKSGNVPEKIIKTIGNKVVNLSIVPKIREQTVTFVAKGLKPRKNVYAFFGDTPVTSHVKQASYIVLSNVSSSNVFRTTSGNFETVTIQGTGATAGNTAKVVHMTDRDAQNGCAIFITDLSDEAGFTVGNILKGNDTGANGTISAVTHYNFTDSSLSVLADGSTAGVFEIPPGNFTGSENLFRLTDDPDNIPGTTTSVAEDIFYTKGVQDKTNENGVVSLRPIITRREDITEERVTRVTTDARQSKSTNWYNPMAQSFFIDKNQYPNGLFLDGVTLFFDRKDESTASKNPVILQIRPMINGLPSSSSVIPGSEVILTPGRVTANTSIPVANSSGGFPGASLGNSETANKNGLNVGSRTRFKFDHPVFLPADEYAIVLITNSSQYSVYGFELGAKHTNSDRKITNQPYVGSFFQPSNSGVWEQVINQGLMFQVERCEFTTQSGYGRFDNLPVSAANATSNTIIDSMKIISDVVEFANTKTNFFYYPTIKNANSKSSDTTVSPVNGFKVLPNKTIDLKKQHQITYTTSGTQYGNSFSLNVYFETANTLISPIIDQSRLNIITIENEINNGSISNDDIIVTANGTGYDSDLTDNTSVFVVSAPDVGSNTALLKANLTTGTTQINKVWVSHGGSGYLTKPTITVYDGGTSNVAGSGATVEITGEGSNGSNMMTANVTHSTGGNMEARYISRRVTLEEGFDARDLRVYLSAYKPRGSNIYVYYKVLANDDPEPFDEKPYILMNQETSATTYSLNEDDIKNYVYKTEDEYINYTNASGARFKTFRTFAIKVVFTLDRVAQDTFIGIPRLNDIKAIALDSEGNP